MATIPLAARAVTWREKIDALGATLNGAGPHPLSALLPGPGQGGNMGGAAWRSPLPDLEKAAVNGDAARPSDDDPQAVRRVVVVGGGTAGYLTALALRARRPWLEVTLIESSKIPVIGVGEATTPPLLAFLHHYLGVDPARFP